MQNAVLVRPDSNLLFSIVENRIKIVGLRFDSTLKLKSKNPNTSIGPNMGKNDFTVFIRSSTTDTLELIKDGKLIFKKNYQIAKTCNPKILFGKDSSRIISINEILLNPGVDFTFLCAYKLNVIIKGFTFSIVRNNYDTSAIMNVDGNKFQRKQLSIIGSLKSGDKIIMTDFRPQGADSYCMVTYNDCPIQLTIK